MTRKILHAADIHLDSPLISLDTYEGAPAEKIRGASRQALENMTGLAIEQSVDVVVIAGDLYDGDWPDQNTGLFFCAQASRLINAGIHLAVIRGNHDAANRITSNLPLPKNRDGSDVMLSEKRVDLHRLDSLGIAVHGRSYRQRDETANLAEQYPAPLGGMFNIGLLHTGLSGLPGHASYAPCTPGQLADKHYDYWALGHIHTRDEHQIAGAAPVVFSGNLQGRHVRECGPKGCSVIEIDDRQRCVDRRFFPCDVVRWEVCSIDASQLHNQEELFDTFRHWLAEQLPAVEDRLLVARVELQGATAEHHRLVGRQEQLESSLRAIAVHHGAGQVWLERLRVRTRSAAGGSSDQSVSSEDLASIEGPMQSVLEVADELKADQRRADWVHQELESLLRKFPPQWQEDPESLAYQLEQLTAGEGQRDGDDLRAATTGAGSQTDIERWIDDAAAELTGRLMGSRT